MENIDDEQIKTALKSKTEDVESDKVVDDETSVLLAKEMLIKIDDNKYKITLNGYSMTDRIITLYASEDNSTGNKKYIFYNALQAPSEKKNTLGESHVLNNRKAFEIIIHEEEGVALKDYLGLRGLINIREIPYLPTNEIILELTRKESNEFITIGELTVKGTNIKGVTLELGKGSLTECQSGCYEAKRDKFECKRIPANTYNFVLNTQLTKSGQHTYKTLRLTDTKKDGSTRDGILIHRGNAYSWSQGCILAMYSDELEEILANPSGFINESNMAVDSYDDKIAGSSAFAMALYEYIKEKDPDESMLKKIVIVDDTKNLSIDTKPFKNKQKAGKYYYSLNIESLAQNEAEELSKEKLISILEDENVYKEFTQKEDEIRKRLSDGELIANEVIQTQLESKWNEIIQAKADNINSQKLASKVTGSLDDFMVNLKENVKRELEKQAEPEVLNVLTEMFRDGSQPYSPIKNYYLKSNNKGYKEVVNSKVNDANVTAWITEIRNQRISQFIDSINFDE